MVELTLEELYNARRHHQWSINEHMDALRRYAEECEVIVEFGTHVGFSTVAFLCGHPKEMHCWDVEYHDYDLNPIAALAAEAGIGFHFNHQSSLEAEFESCDLLFLDSLHDYAQVQQELASHGHKAKKYLIFHDTVERATTDETPSANEVQGIIPAINEYMALHPEWELAEHFEHQYGLTVYRRRGE